MLDWQLLFSGTAESARELARELDRHDVRSFVEDLEGPVVTHGGGRERHSVVVVPPEEMQCAESVANRWRAQNVRNVYRLSAQIRRVFVLGSLPPAAWILTSAALGRSSESELGWLVGAWLLSLIVAAQMEHRATSPRASGTSSFDHASVRVHDGHEG